MENTFFRHRGNLTVNSHCLTDSKIKMILVLKSRTTNPPKPFTKWAPKQTPTTQGNIQRTTLSTITKDKGYAALTHHTECTNTTYHNNKLLQISNLILAIKFVRSVSFFIMTILIKLPLLTSRYIHIKEACFIASQLRTATPNSSHNVAIIGYMITTKYDNPRDQNDETQNPHSKINAIDQTKQCRCYLST